MVPDVPNVHSLPPCEHLMTEFVETDMFKSWAHAPPILLHQGMAALAAFQEAHDGELPLAWHLQDANEVRCKAASKPCPSIIFFFVPLLFRCFFFSVMHVLSPSSSSPWHLRRSIQLAGSCWPTSEASTAWRDGMPWPASRGSG